MPSEAPVLTLLAGLAVCRAIRQQTGLQSEIKWPNDILISGKKSLWYTNRVRCRNGQCAFCNNRYWY